MTYLLVFSSLTSSSYAQNVWTWHNDNNRTGWQPNETALKPSTVSQSTFGLLWHWPVNGFVRAQPLAVTNVQTIYTGCQPCNLVFVATEGDVLYAFKADSNSQTAVWSRDLAAALGTDDTAVNCNNLNGLVFGPCDAGVLGNLVGVTGTPVIDTSNNTLYVVAAVRTSSAIVYELFAVDITSGAVSAMTTIGGSVSGQPPAQNQGLICTSTYPAQGQVSFDPGVHIQRSALLLLGGVVYVAFGPFPEFFNGWLFGYTRSGSSFSPTAIFNSTPYGTGGGIWQAGAGPAAETRGGSSYIYAATGNGTFDVSGTSPIATDIGDSLLKFNPSNLAVVDYYTPSDILTFVPDGRCKEDEDFGSGGVLVIPDTFYNGLYLVVNADKESKLYVANRDSLGHFNPSGGNNLQTITTPPVADSLQGYWASPAYWTYTSGSTTNYMLYYSVTTATKTAVPYPINGYQLLTTGSSGPIPSSPTASTGTLFCLYSPTPSISSNGTTAGTGIVWAIEHGNKHNPQLPTSDCNGGALPAALHAFDATTLTELYNGRGVTTGGQIGFSTPTIFNGRVYMGTTTEVDVFGLLH